METQKTDSQENKKVLIVDDDSLITNSLKLFCEKKGFSASSTSSGKKALTFIENKSPEIVFLDIQLPDTDGLSLLKTIKELHPSITVVIITGHANIRNSVEAIKEGALDYLEKPLDFGQLENLLNMMKEQKTSFSNGLDSDEIIFLSKKMREVVRVVSQLAMKSDITILLLGESGTGKNLICRKIHNLSPRKDNPFIEIGCTSIPEHLFESELFGYEKGAFTDAKGSKKGLFEVADGGTVFLDEIGDMPFNLQSRILKLIEEKNIRRIGGLKSRTVDVRICAATNRDLSQLVKQKKFRLDLFYRLNVATVSITPLRERKEDILPLVNYFMEIFSQKYRCEPKKLTQEAETFILEYAWPGNVRELKNTIEKLMVICPALKITVSDIPLQDHDMSEEPGADEDILDAATDLSLHAMEENYIKTALKLSEGNQRKAARLLNISRDTLRYRLKKLGLKSSLFS